MLQARRILESELRDERAARVTAEEARAKAEADRSRLQLGQDDLAAQVGAQSWQHSIPGASVAGAFLRAECVWFSHSVFA